MSVTIIRIELNSKSRHELSEELQNYGPKVMLTYGGGSIKRNGIYDIMSHILEQYLSDSDDNTSDYIAEGLMRSLIVSSRKALQPPQDYEARSNIMWTATWALNGLTACGKSTDWMVHMLGQAVAAYTDACSVNEGGYVTLTRQDAGYKYQMPLASCNLPPN